VLAVVVARTFDSPRWCKGLGTHAGWCVSRDLYTIVFPRPSGVYVFRAMCICGVYVLRAMLRAPSHSLDPVACICLGRCVYVLRAMLTAPSYSLDRQCVSRAVKNVRTATTTYGIIAFPRPSGVYVLRATCIVCASPKHSALEFSERTLVGVYHPETLDDP
jgi:hypothetical protein